MAGSIDFSALTNASANVGDAVWRGFEQGRRQRQDADTRNALAAYSADPANAGALNALMALAPREAIALRGLHNDEQDRQRDSDFRSAFRDYQRGGQAPPMNALTPPAPMPPGAPAGGPANLMPEHPALDDDDAWSRMLEADPVGALKARVSMDEAAGERLKVIDSAYDFAIERLANVSDEGSYQAARQGFLQTLAPLGVDLGDKIPASYPGPEGVRSLLMSAMDAKDQIAAVHRTDRFEHDVADDEADNARADRNTDSLIADRGERRDIQRSRPGGRRNPPAPRQPSTPNAVYARLLDKQARGEALTPAEQQVLSTRSSPAPRRGRGGKGGGGGAIHVNPETGERIQWNGSEWAPVQ